MGIEMRIYLDKEMFHIDLVNKRFVEVANSLNTIPFSRLGYDGEYYSLHYDPETKHIAEKMPDGNYPPGCKQIQLPDYLLKKGYKEGSDLAYFINKGKGEIYHFRLMDEKALFELDNNVFQNQRTGPEVNLEGDVFIADVTYSELRLKQNPLNVITFRDMVDKGSYYLLYYDKVRKMSANFLSDQDAVVPIKVRQMVSLDPDGVAQKYGIPVASLPQRDSELQGNPELIEKRLKGSLPKIKIVDEEYFIDLRLLELRAVSQHFKKVSLQDLYLNGDGEKYYGFYDLAKKRFVDTSPDITEYPKNVVMAVLPHELWLDPVASGRRHLDDEMGYLQMFPIIANLEARIFPLSQSPLAELIRKNTEQVHEQKNSKGKAAGK